MRKYLVRNAVAKISVSANKYQISNIHLARHNMRLLNATGERFLVNANASEEVAYNTKKLCPL